MRIEGINNSPYSASSITRTQAEPTDTTFGSTIKQAVSEVNRLQVEADQLANKLATGDAVEVHQAMIAMRKASTALQFTIQVRNKIIEAYQEIMRMQV
ncbi:MAG: flagellar hook-basal body complex protein FliE [Armatimonadetes bacterium]|nr:flagellar hook-basal body complex protein FliE [Armatimonadota bacterium]